MVKCSQGAIVPGVTLLVLISYLPLRWLMRCLGTGCRLEIAASAWRPPRNDILIFICHCERSDAISAGMAPWVLYSCLQLRSRLKYLVTGCWLEIAASVAALLPRNDIINPTCHRERSDAISSWLASAST